MPSFADPRSCLRGFLQTGRNLGRRPPSFSLRNVQRDIRSVKTRLENIGDRVEGAIGAAARGEFLPGQLFSITNEFRCPPTHHASYFAQHRPPKFKFMFFVEVRLNPDFFDAFQEPWSEGSMWWFIKQSGRPNVSYEYEDLNMYNFRQKAIRRATFNPIQIQMYDDISDVSAGFWNTFLRIQSPVTNIYGRRTQQMLENSGMNWNDIQFEYLENHARIRSKEGESVDTSVQTSASTGVLPSRNAQTGNGYSQILNSITVYHLIDWGQKYVRYDYSNPRINTVNFDDLTWESSEPNVIDVEFEYDTFSITFPNGVSEQLFEGGRLPPIYPINPNLDETPSTTINEGINGFNNFVGNAIDKAKQVGSSIPGFGNIREF